MSGARRKVSASSPEVQRPLPPPAPPGNLRAATHGAFSDRFVLRDADELVDVLYDAVPHLRDDDYLAVRDYAICQVRVWRLSAWLDANGDFDRRSRPRPALELLRRWLDRADRARSRLGLDPISRAALRVDESLVMSRVLEWEQNDLEEGRRLHQRSRRQRAGSEGGDRESR